MSKLLIGASVLIATIGSASADTIHKQVPSGSTALIWIYRNFDANCNDLPGTVTVVAKPAHGRISQRRAKSRIGSVRYQGAHCIGQMSAGLEVRYQAGRGFRGTDSFTLDVNWPVNNRHVTDTFVIDVQ